MKKAVIVTSYPFPDAGATASRVQSLATALNARSGWHVVVVGPGPNPERIKEVENNNDFTTITRSIRSVRTRLLLRRVWFELHGSLKLLRTARAERPDALIITVPSVFLLVTLMRVRSNVLVVDIRDRVWEYLQYYGGIKKAIGRLSEYVLARLLRRVSFVSVISAEERAEIARTLSVEAIVIRNGISRDRFERLALCARGTPGEAQGKSEKQLNIVYAGNIGIAQELDTVIRAVADRPTFALTLVGEGSDSDRLRALVDDLGAHNVRFVGEKAWEETLAYYFQADVLYGQVGASYVTAVPTKIFEYISAGRDVVFGAPVGAARDVLEEFEGIWCVTPGDVEELRKVLDDIQDSAPIAKGLVEENREKIKRFYLREEQAERFADWIVGTA